MNPLAAALAAPVRAYRLILSPWVGHHCRYMPTCSSYALVALERHGGVKGGWLALRRILRCHPWGGSGVDEVPPACGCADGRAQSSTRSKKMITSPRSTPKRDT